MAQIRRGEDKVITITLNDDNGTAINLSTAYTGLVCYLTTDDGNILQQYSRETLTGHNSSDFNQLNQSTNTGQFEIRLQSAITKPAPVGQFFLEVKAQAADANFTNYTFQTVARISTSTGNVDFEFVDAITKNIDTLA